MSGNASMVNGHIDTIEKADCSKCATDCRCKDWFEHEMLVAKIGCRHFKSRSDAE